MKNILVLTAFYKPFIGGAERFVEGFVARCPDTVRLTVFTARLKRSSPRLEIVNGVIIRRIGLGFPCDKFLFPFLATVHALGCSYDCVYAVMESYAGCGAFFIRMATGTPYVLNLQSGTLGMPEYRMRIRLIMPLYRAIYRAAWRVHAVSGSLRDRALSLGVLKGKIIIIPNGIDCAFYVGQRDERVSGRIVVLARLEEPKGVRYAIEAMKYVLLRAPEARLVIAGDGSLHSSLEALAGECGVSHAVSFLGRVEPHFVPAVLRSGSCFVCPSVAEGFGIGILEAMAAGMPVVATEVGGIPDIITDGISGVLVPPRDPRALAAGILRVFYEQGLHERLIASGRVRAQSFDLDSVMPRVYSLFE